jgi:hypothetical protein
MRNALFLSVALFGLLQSPALQSQSEIAALRKNLGIPATVNITAAHTMQLPTERPLKVYIDTGGDASAAVEVNNFIEALNAKQENEYGQIEIVNGAAAASLWLIQYEVPGTRRKEAEAPNSRAADPTIGGKQIANVTKAEVRGYVLASKPEGLEILSRYTKEVTLGDRHRELRAAFSKFLKEQAKAEIQ